MSRIPKETIDRIKDQSDIVSTISEYVDLKKSGSNYLGLCPFHNEKTPSFTVSPTKEIFRCFGCGEGGDVISFIMKKENMSYPEAIRFLADKLSIPIENEDFDRAKYEKKMLYFKINEDARNFFFQNLLINNFPKSYLKKRNINNECINYFFIGYADEKWDSLLNHMTGLGYDPEDLFELGLIGRSEKGNFYDTFRNRLIFPIQDIRKKVLGFGGRTLVDDRAKYINSKESLIYQKRRNIYGSMNLNNIQKKNEGILVEGYMDVISLYNYGIDNAIATLGTAITKDQAQLMKRYTKNLFIAYDGDEAGIKATQKAIDIFKEVELEPKIIKIPNNDDPDDYIQKSGTQAFQNLLRNAYLPFIYNYDIIISRYDLRKLEDRLKIKDDVIELLLKEESPIKRDEYIRYVAEDLKMNEESLRVEIDSQDNRETQPNIINLSESKLVSQHDEKAKKLSKSIIMLMIYKREYFEILKEYNRFIIEEDSHLEFFEKIKKAYSNQEVTLTSFDETLIDKYQLASYQIVGFTPEEVDEIYQNLLKKLKRRKLFDTRKTLLDEINILRSNDLEGDKNLKEIYYKKLRELIELDRQIRS